MTDIIVTTSSRHSCRSSGLDRKQLIFGELALLADKGTGQDPQGEHGGRTQRKLVEDKHPRVVRNFLSVNYGESRRGVFFDGRKNCFPNFW